MGNLCASRRVLDDQHHMLYRQYTIWPGNNRFLWAGSLIAGPSLRNMKLTLLAITCGALLQLANLLLHVDSMLLYIPLIVLYLKTIVHLVVTVLTDPGIIPRNMEGLSIDADLLCLPTMAYSFKPTVVPSHNELHNYKFCQTCYIYRPPRTVHCRLCDNCVEVLDHHCIWLDTCIGKRNYKSFFKFLLFLAMFLLHLLSFQVYLLTTHHNITLVLPISLLIMSLGFGAFVWYMLTYHCYLVWTNQTTNEDIKRLHEVRNASLFSKYQYACTRLCECISTRSLLNLKAKIHLKNYGSKVATEQPLQSLVIQQSEELISSGKYSHQFRKIDEQGVITLLKQSQLSQEVFKSVRAKLRLQLSQNPSRLLHDHNMDAEEVCTLPVRRRLVFSQRKGNTTMDNSVCQLNNLSMQVSKVQDYSQLGLGSEKANHKTNPNLPAYNGGNYFIAVQDSNEKSRQQTNHSQMAQSIVIQTNLSEHFEARGVETPRYILEEDEALSEHSLPPQ